MEEKESFAERMLRKQGWTDGQGLGKTQQGIVDPIKPTLKFDKTGIGHDHAEEFTNVWINNLQNIIYSDAVSRWAEWVLAHPEFGSSVNPIPTVGEADLEVV